VYSYLSLALALSRLPLIYRMGDCPPADSKFNFAIWRMAMSRTTRVVANSRFVRNSAVRAGVPAEKVEIIYGFAPKGGEEAAERGTDLCEQLERIVYVGALAEHKGLIPLVEAMAVLLPERPLLHLDIFGGSVWDEAFRIQLSGLIADRGLSGRIVLHGHVDDPSPHYRRAAVHLVPSIWEEPGANVVLEAKRQGTPSVVFPSGGLPEIVRHQVDGYVCRGKSTDALVEALHWMLDDPVRLLSMRTAALKDHDQRFSEQRFSNQWAAVYCRGSNPGCVPSGGGDAG
jgi:glycosyltransferase involved in cell wall biosynthesis